jgi:hypothetical protein
MYMPNILLKYYLSWNAPLKVSQKLESIFLPRFLGHKNNTLHPLYATGVMGELPRQ